MMNTSIEITNDDHILGSFLASGIDMSKGEEQDPKASDVATIPGLVGSGPGSNNHDNATTTAGPDGSSDSGNGLQGTVVATGTGSAATGFVQSDGSDSSSGAAPLVAGNEHALQGSLFAVVVAIIGLCVL